MWEKIWDNQSKEFYYWNTQTDETTWTLPKDFIDSADPTAKTTTNLKETDPTSQTVQGIPEGMDYNSKEYYDWYMEQVTRNAQLEATAQFASFQKKNQYEELNLLQSDQQTNSQKYNRAFNQMGMFFDVNEYQQRRAKEAVVKKKQPKLTSKQIEKFKKKKKERQVQSLIYRLGPDE